MHQRSNDVSFVVFSLFLNEMEVFCHEKIKQQECPEICEVNEDQRQKSNVCVYVFTW